MRTTRLGATPAISIWLAAALSAAAISTAAAADPPGFLIDARPDLLAPLMDDEELGARIVVYVAPDDGPRDPTRYTLERLPAVFAADVPERWEGAAVSIGVDADAYPAPIDRLAPGWYRARAVLDRRHLNSDWRREPGNLVSGVSAFRAPLAEPLVLTLDHAPLRDEPAAPHVDLSAEPQDAGPGAAARRPGAEIRVSLSSPLLSGHRDAGALHHAALHTPADPSLGPADAPAIVVIPGFGGDHTDGHPWRADHPIARRATVVVLDPEGPNGHHKFIDSPSNGPVGAALVTELIPALVRHRLITADASRRIVVGHSSGGFAAVHLLLAYPEVFARALASAPDPLDFRAFVSFDLYADANAYTDAGGTERAAVVDAAGTTILSVRDENAFERVLHPGNRSAQQWDAWHAAFGPAVAGTTTPFGLFDTNTGAIHDAARARARAADIGARLAADPGRLLPLFADRVRIVIGDRDEYLLHRAAMLLRDRLDALAAERSRPPIGDAVLTVIRSEDRPAGAPPGARSPADHAAAARYLYEGPFTDDIARFVLDRARSSRPRRRSR